MDLLPKDSIPLSDKEKNSIEFVQFFTQRANREYNKRVNGINNDALELFHSYSWRENLRELQNVVNRAVVLAEGETITPQTSPDEIRYYVKEDFSSAEILNGTVKKLKAATERTHYKWLKRQQ